MSNRMSNRSIATALAVVVAVIATAAGPASATSCQNWRRMNDDQRYDRIYRMIDDAIAGNRGRQTQVNRAEIARCLEGEVESLFWKFDDTCSNPRTARSQAIRQIFKNAIWTCVN